MSYASEDREVAGQLAGDLVARGLHVWWDRLIEGGTVWAEEIDRALANAAAVVVLWSPASSQSHFVRAEARAAAERSALVPAIIDACQPPMPFGEYQTLDLTRWRVARDGTRTRSSDCAAPSAPSRHDRRLPHRHQQPHRNQPLAPMVRPSAGMRGTSSRS